MASKQCALIALVLDAVIHCNYKIVKFYINLDLKNAIPIHLNAAIEDYQQTFWIMSNAAFLLHHYQGSSSTSSSAGGTR